MKGGKSIYTSFTPSSLAWSKKGQGVVEAEVSQSLLCLQVQHWDSSEPHKQTQMVQPIRYSCQLALGHRICTTVSIRCSHSVRGMFLTLRSHWNMCISGGSLFSAHLCEHMIVLWMYGPIKTNGKWSLLFLWALLGYCTVMWMETLDTLYTGVRMCVWRAGSVCSLGFSHGNYMEWVCVWAQMLLSLDICSVFACMKAGFNARVWNLLEDVHSIV